MFQDKIKREKPSHHDAPVRFSPVADVLDSERPVDPLAGNPACLSTAVKGHITSLSTASLVVRSMSFTKPVRRVSGEVLK